MKNNKINLVFATICLMLLFACNDYEPSSWYVVNNCDCIDKENHTYGSVTDIYLNTYRTVTIGNQEWMAENLKTTTYNDGTPISNKIGADWGLDTNGAYCWYNNDKGKYKEQYGALYNWYTVETEKLCPVGWHVPSVDDWNELFDFVSPDEYISFTGKANMLMAPRCWYENSKLINIGTDDFGFSALGAGERLSGSCCNDFRGLNTETGWWSSTEYGNDEPVVNNYQAFYCYMSPFPVGSAIKNKYAGLSVRCVKD